MTLAEAYLRTERHTEVIALLDGYAGYDPDPSVDGLLAEAWRQRILQAREKTPGLAQMGGKAVVAIFYMAPSGISRSPSPLSSRQAILDWTFSCLGWHREYSASRTGKRFSFLSP